jgi:hypothetical protein
MRVQDVLEIGEAGRLPFVGIGLLAIALPFVMPSLRPQLGKLLSGAAKLFAEAEFGADDALTDRLVDASVNALMRIAPTGTVDEQRRRTDRELDRFFSRARTAAHRRGHSREDAGRRYHKHLSRMEHALKSRQGRTEPRHRQTVDRALHRLAEEQNTTETSKTKPPDRNRSRPTGGET